MDSRKQPTATNTWQRDASTNTNVDQPTNPDARESGSLSQVDAPKSIGRYRVLATVGEGGFGRVYLGHDDQLDRRVAIKVPLEKRRIDPKDLASFQVEARSLEESGSNTGSNTNTQAVRKANSAIALMMLGEHESVWTLFLSGADSRVRSYLIHRAGPCGVDPAILIRRLRESDVAPSQLAGLMMTLGGYDVRQIFQGKSSAFIDECVELARSHPHPGVHGAACWLLTKWGQSERLRTIITELSGQDISKDRQWYVNSEGHTMVIIPGPVEFTMGSPVGEAGRGGSVEDQRRRRIERTIGIASKEVTVHQWRRFIKATKLSHSFSEKYAPESGCPVADFASWKQAYDAFADERKGMGVVGDAVFKSADEANDVTVWHDFETIESANTFADSTRLREVMSEAGVVGGPTIWFTAPV